MSYPGSLIKAQPFFQLGGFNPAICGTEDEDLCRRFAFWGEFANKYYHYHRLSISRAILEYFYQLPARVPRHQALT